MSELIVRREPLGSSVWLVVTPAGLELTRTADRPAAMARATRLLQESGGGTLRVADERGALGPPVRVDQQGGGAGKQDGDLGTLAEKLAGLTDKAIGRTEAPKDPLRGKVEGLTVDQVLPPKIAQSKAVKIFNHNVSAGAAMIAVVGFVFAGGTVSAIVTPALQSLADKATVGSYITVGQAFWTTLALSICAGAALYGARTGFFRSYGSVAAFFIGMLVVLWMAYEAGLAGPTPSAVLVATSDVSNPIAKVLGAFGVFLVFYGPVPFLSGAIAGGCAGNIVYELEKPG